MLQVEEPKAIEPTDEFNKVNEKLRERKGEK